MLLADCCRTDPAGGRGRDIPNDVLDKTPPKGVYAFFSCGKGEKAFEHKDLQHGVFFYQVLEGLKGAAEDSDDDVTFEALTLQVRKRVPTEVHRLFGDTTHQTPTLKMVEASGAPLVLLSRREKEIDADLAEVEQLIRIGKGSKGFFEQAGPKRCEHWRSAAEAGSRGANTCTVGRWSWGLGSIRTRRRRCGGIARPPSRDLRSPRTILATVTRRGRAW